MDSVGVAIGNYELQLESYDASGSIQSTLKTDIIQISIKAVQDRKQEAALIVEQQQSIFISAIEMSSWTLHFNETNVKEVEIEVQPDLARFITFDGLGWEITFDGSESSSFLSGEFRTISIKVTLQSGAEVTVSQLLLF